MDAVKRINLFGARREASTVTPRMGGWDGFMDDKDGGSGVRIENSVHLVWRIALSFSSDGIADDVLNRIPKPTRDKSNKILNLIWILKLDRKFKI